MSQPASAAPSRKKTVISLLVLAALTGIIVLLFKDNWAEITAALSQLSAWQVLVVLAIGLSYPLLEGCVAWVIVRSRIPGFRLWQGIDTAWCGTFGNVVTLGAGAVPVQTWYLHRCGLPVGPGVGLMTLQYVFHKTTVLLYATVMLLFQHRWLAANTTGVMNYLPMAYAVVAAIIVVLVLVCVSPLVQNLARWLMRLLPKTEKWQQRRADWQQQLDVLGEESRRLLADKPRCAEILALQAVKLFGLFCLPYLCIRFMGLSPLSFLQVQLLTSLMLFLSNALPNVAGMGSIETAFLLVFGSSMGSYPVPHYLGLTTLATKNVSLNSKYTGEASILAIIMMIFGVLGYLLRKFDLNNAAVVLALILGPIGEKGLRRSLALSKGSPAILFSTPVCWVLIVLCIFGILSPIFMNRMEKMSMEKAGEQ